MADVTRPSLTLRLAQYARKMVGSAPPAETVVVCPPKQMPAKLELDSGASIVGCTRLPAQGSCEQGCAAQLQYSPTDLSVFLREYESKECEHCGKTIDASDWYASRSKLQSASRRPATTASRPLCFTCWNRDEV
jgi:hypothetical protein